MAKWSDWKDDEGQLSEGELDQPFRISSSTKTSSAAIPNLLKRCLGYIKGWIQRRELATSSGLWCWWLIREIAN